MAEEEGEDSESRAAVDWGEVDAELNDTPQVLLLHAITQ